MRVITISGNPRHPGRYKVSASAEKFGRAVSYDAANCGDAAAKALDWALAQKTPYVIVGCDWVMDMIPRELHHRQ